MKKTGTQWQWQWEIKLNGTGIGNRFLELDNFHHYLSMAGTGTFLHVCSSQFLYWRFIMWQCRQFVLVVTSVTSQKDLRLKWEREETVIHEQTANFDFDRQPVEGRKCIFCCPTCMVPHDRCLSFAALAVVLAMVFIQLIYPPTPPHPHLQK